MAKNSRLGQGGESACESSAIRFRIENGIHVDLAAGGVQFSGGNGEAVSVHVEEALIRTAGTDASHGAVRLLAPKILEVTAQSGGLDFSYRDEYQYLGEGQTYRIDLDAASEPQGTGAGAAGKSGKGGKIAYFIVAGAAGAAGWAIHGLTAGWAIHGLTAGAGENPPESPYKP